MAAADPRNSKKPELNSRVLTMAGASAGFSKKPEPNSTVLKMAAAGVATCLFTRLEESSLVPAGFLTAQFLQKT